MRDNKRAFVAGLLLGAVLMGSVGVAYAQDFVIIVPTEYVTRVVDAWSIGLGWTADDPMTKGDFAKDQLLRVMRARVIEYERILARHTADEAAAAQAALDMENLTIQ